MEGDQRTGQREMSKLTDDDLTEVEEKVEKLVGLLQKKYGYSREKVEKENREFISRYEEPPSAKR